MLLIACTLLWQGQTAADEGAASLDTAPANALTGDDAPRDGVAGDDQGDAEADAAAADGSAADTSQPAGESEGAAAKEAGPAEPAAGVSANATTTVVDGQDSIAPLRALVEEADRLIARFEEEIESYSCLLIKRERIDGELSPHQYVWMKVREQQQPDDGEPIPFGIYLKYLKPRSVAGREVLFVEGQRSGDMLVRKGGVFTPYVTVRLNPFGSQARQASRYAITQSGLRFLIQELRSRIASEIEFAHCEVREYADAKLDGRPCRHIVVQHDERHPELNFSSARVFLDEELDLPVYFAAYGWPEKEGQSPPLLEEFLFTKIQLNPRFTAKDFQEENDAYGFQIEK